jgi:hypothetical protein
MHDDKDNDTDHIHDHDHDQKNDYNHDHCHAKKSEDNTGKTPSQKTTSGKAKEKQILAYMLEHNKQHAKELIDIAVKLENKGANDTAAIIRNSVYDYETGNDKLAAALETL